MYTCATLWACVSLGALLLKGHNEGAQVDSQKAATDEVFPCTYFWVCYYFFFIHLIFEYLII